MKRRAWIAAAAVLVVGVAAVAVFAGGSRAPSGDLVIPKGEIGAEARFYPYKSGKVTMEVLALKAPDGTIRTALNTCQVCYGSGRGYYTQEGDVLVCNNCGNRFQARQVELIKGGCNPVPVTKEYKSETSETIVISKAFLDEASVLFRNWKKR